MSQNPSNTFMTPSMHNIHEYIQIYIYNTYNFQFFVINTYLELISFFSVSSSWLLDIKQSANFLAIWFLLACDDQMLACDERGQEKNGKCTCQQKN